MSAELRCAAAEGVHEAGHTALAAWAPQHLTAGHVSMGGVRHTLTTHRLLTQHAKVNDNVNLNNLP